MRDFRTPLIITLFMVEGQRVGVITYRCFGITDRSSSGLKNIHEDLFLNPEDGTAILYRNVCKKWPLLAAQQPRRAQNFSLFGLHYNIVCGNFVTARDVRTLAGLICSQRIPSSKLHLNTFCPDISIVAEGTELSKNQWPLCPSLPIPHTYTFCYII
jgi:hypothetical protein